MERLWSPWRLKYIEGAAASQCVFCDAAATAPLHAAASTEPPAHDAAHRTTSTTPHGAPGTAPSAPDAVPDDLVVARRPLAFVILNLYPYNNGHLMVVPNRHIASLAAATDDELTEVMRLVRDSEVVLHEAYHPQGVNVGINLGRAAGAGIADHLHVHLVPRWSGDSNFMSVIGETRVLPETLEQTASRLRPVFHRLLD
jgi:ATP adenylyltransferase